MKFKKYLDAEAIPEWRNQYIDYKGLKKLITQIENTNTSHFNHEKAASHTSTPSNGSFVQFPEQSNIRQDHARRIGVISTASIFQRLSTNFMAFSKRGSSVNPVSSPLSEQENMFYDALTTELAKVSMFYQGKEGEVVKDLNLLKDQLKSVKKARRAQLRKKLPARDSLSLDLHSIHQESQPDIDYKKIKTMIGNAVLEYYRGLDLLANYRALNKLGFVKILKKFDKVTQRDSTKHMSFVYASNFVTSKVLSRLIKDTENFYVENFEKGMRKKAMLKLRIPSRTRQTFHLPVMRFGLYMGLSFCLIARGLQIAAPWNDQDYKYIFIYILYGSFLLPIVFTLLFGVNMIIWTNARVNYKFIFDFDSRDNLNYQEFLELGALALLVLSTAFFLTFALYSPVFPLEWYPSLFVMVFFMMFFCPFPVLYHDARQWLIITFGKVISSPFSPVEFGSFFLADAMNSLANCLVGMGVFICVYSNHWDKDALDDQCTPWNSNMAWHWPAMLSSLPPLWRILQVFRRYVDSNYEPIHLINIGKYASSILATWLLSYRHNYMKEWLVFQTINSLYTFTWDIYIDWNLLDPNSNNRWLRNILGFKNEWVYYYAIISNFFLRFLWVLFLINSKYVPFMIFFTSFGEMLRRLQWAIFRVENEHATNYSFQRAFRAVPNIKDFDVPNRDSSQTNNKQSRPGSRVMHIARSWVPELSPQARDFTPRIDQSIPDMFFSGEDDDEDDDDDEDEDGEYDDEFEEQSISHRDSLNIPYFDDVERRMRERENSLRMLESGAGLMNPTSAFLQGRRMKFTTFDGYNSRRLPFIVESQRLSRGSVGQRNGITKNIKVASNAVEELDVGDIKVTNQNDDLDSIEILDDTVDEKEIDAGDIIMVTYQDDDQDDDLDNIEILDDTVDEKELEADSFIMTDENDDL